MEGIKTLTKLDKGQFIFIKNKYDNSRRGMHLINMLMIFLFLFGDFLEGRTLAKTRSSLKELTDMAPQEANVIRNGEQHTINVDEVMVGDRVLIHPGGKIPVDGYIVKGEASVNESTVTG